MKSIDILMWVDLVLHPSFRGRRMLCLVHDGERG